MRNFKKIIFSIVLIAILTLGYNVEAACYKKCTYPMAPGTECPYVRECVSGGSVECEEVHEYLCLEEGPKREELKEKVEDMGGCSGYTYETSCQDNKYYSCLWNETKYGEYCNTDKLIYVSCGDAFDIPHEVPKLISFLVNLLKIATPIILIVIGIISLLKALAASSEDEIKKAQKSLIKKIIAAVMVFFIVYIVQFVIMKVADSSERDDLSSCLSCFLNNDCGANVYYKTNVFGKYECTYLDGNTKFTCKENQ